MPKPWVRVARRMLIEHALAVLLDCPGLAGGVVVLAPGERRHQRLPAAVRRRLRFVDGGRDRARSVLNGLRALDGARKDDWVLVHDAARPCLPPSDLIALLSACQGSPVGGLLAVPVAETVKRADRRGRSASTLARETLWRAQTPQMFRYGLLRRGLEQALAARRRPTDEAAAVEALGKRPLLVEGSPLNVKVTRPADLAFVKAALALLEDEK